MNGFSTAALLVLWLAPAQDGSPSDPLGKPRELLRTGRSREASELLMKKVEAEPENGQAWFLYGYALHADGRFGEAALAHARAAEFPELAVKALYNLACAEARVGRSDEALAALLRARELGFNDDNSLWTDADLDSLREDERFAALLPEVVPVLEGDALFAEPTRILHTLVGEAPGDQYGWVARAVGDLDGDGAIDFAATAPTHRTRFPGGGAAGGKVYVHSSRSGALLFEHGGRAGEQLGNGVAGAGDVDGDGTPDVIVGAPGLGDASGHAYVLSGANGKVFLTLSGDAPGDRFGATVAGAGDLDGDGRADLLVGAPGAGRSAESAAPSGIGAGRVLAFSGASGKELARVDGEFEGGQLGSALAASTGAPRLVVAGAMTGGQRGTGRATVYRFEEGELQFAFAIEGDAQSANLGQYFVSVLGDVDGDGCPDVYASDWSHSGAAAGAGRVYVHSGATGAELLHIDGKQAGGGFGTSPSDAGDANGDGVADLVVGAWQHRSGAPSGGQVTLHSGRDGATLATWTCRQAGDTFGFDATGLGDVDGDGSLDYLLTSAWSPARGPRTGRVFVIAGPVLDSE